MPEEKIFRKRRKTTSLGFIAVTSIHVLLIGGVHSILSAFEAMPCNTKPCVQVRLYVPAYKGAIIIGCANDLVSFPLLLSLYFEVGGRAKSHYVRMTSSGSEQVILIGQNKEIGSLQKRKRK